MQEFDFSVYAKYNPLRSNHITPVVTFGSSLNGSTPITPINEFITQSSIVKETSSENEKQNGFIKQSIKQGQGQEDGKRKDDGETTEEKDDGETTEEKDDGETTEEKDDDETTEEKDDGETTEEKDDGETTEEKDDGETTEDEDEDGYEYSTEQIFGSGTSMSILNNLQEKVSQVKTKVEETMKNSFNQSIISQSLTQNIEKTLLHKQYETAAYRLPVVIKELKTTLGKKPPQGLYYLNRYGNKIYLSKSQQMKWKNGEEIAGCIKGCSKDDI